MTLRLIIILSLLLILGSCGKEKSGAQAPAQERKALEELQTNEHAFIKDLVEEGTLTQKEILKRLLSLRELSSLALKRMDQHLTINCNADRKECGFEWKKGNL